MIKNVNVIASLYEGERNVVLIKSILLDIVWGETTKHDIDQ